MRMKENYERAERCVNRGRERKRNRQRVSWDHFCTAASLYGEATGNGTLT